MRKGMFERKDVLMTGEFEISASQLPSPPKKKGFLSSGSSGSATSGKSRKSRTPSPAKIEHAYVDDDEQPIYPPSVAQSQTTNRPPSQSESESDPATNTRGHHRRSTDHTERWHSHASPMIPEIIELR